MKNWLAVLILLTLCCCAVPALADEGMWLFEESPPEAIAQKYGVEVKPELLQRLQGATVRLNSGGSGVFVSDTGLLLVTQHGLADRLAALGVAQDGFLATARSAEMPLKGLELQVLQKVETDGVAAADPDAVALDHGARNHRYRYRTFDDVRLVFVPEAQMAYFGGAIDNYEYPRHCFDVAVLRAYEDGAPAKPPASLKLANQGPKEGDFLLTAGHPQTSERSATVAHLEFLRDVRYPLSLDYLRRLELALLDFASEGREEAAQIEAELESVHHARKLYQGILAVLQDPHLMQQRRQQEQRERAGAESGPWKVLEDRAAHYQGLYQHYYLLAAGRAFNSLKFEQIRAELRGQSVPEGTASEQLERAKLLGSLTLMVDWLGTDDALVKKVLDGHSPEQRAAQLAGDDQEMRRLVESLEPQAQELERRFAAEVMQPVEQAYQDIGRFLMGKRYPEATGTLRWGYGAASGYVDGGRQQSYATTMGSLKARAKEANNAPPWSLAPAWQTNRLDPKCQLNFVATLDVQDGSGGGPVVNSDGEVVGIIFDANRWGMAADYFYDDRLARAISVDAGAILHCLDVVYKAGGLVAELKRVKFQRPID